MAPSSSESPAPILVGTDLSEGADEAVLQADAWSRRTGQPLCVAHAFPDPLLIAGMFPPGGSQIVTDAAAMEVRAAQAVRRRVMQLTRRGSDELEVVVAPGTGHALLIAEAERRKADTVVVGATGHGLVGRVLFGSTADHVLRHAPASVLVARRPPATGLVMVASDLSEAGLVAVRAAVVEARRRRARLLAVHAIATTFAELAPLEPSLAHWDREVLETLRARAAEGLRAQLEACGAEGDALVVEGRPPAAIVQAARDRNAELLVVATHGRTGLMRLALGSVAAAVTRKAASSVLVARVRI
jgi:nucleotide-binding universal stress UspA family protein